MIDRHDSNSQYFLPNGLAVHKIGHQGKIHGRNDNQKALDDHPPGWSNFLSFKLNVRKPADRDMPDVKSQQLGYHLK